MLQSPKCWDYRSVSPCLAYSRRMHSKLMITIVYRPQLFVLVPGLWAVVLWNPQHRGFASASARTHELHSGSYSVTRRVFQLCYDQCHHYSDHFCSKHHCMQHLLRTGSLSDNLLCETQQVAGKESCSLSKFSLPRAYPVTAGTKMTKNLPHFLSKYTLGGYSHLDTPPRRHQPSKQHYHLPGTDLCPLLPRFKHTSLERTQS